MKNQSPEVDAYISRAAPFARPILKKLRAAFHQGCPELQESLKWGMPFFDYRGPLGSMAAFKGHASWGFWRRKELADPHRILSGNWMGGGKLTDVAQLPSEKIIAEYVKAAARLNEAGRPKRPPRKAKPPVKVPPYFLQALRSNRKALAAFERFPPSHRREYVEWIAEAKQEATRARRIATALEWIAEGKSRNWKYEKC